MRASNVFGVGSDDVRLPSLESLQRWSMPTSLCRSTNKLPLTTEIVDVVKADTFVYLEQLENDTELRDMCYRVKSPDSIVTKVQRHANLRFQSVFNDILGIRLRCTDYPEIYPEYLRMVDLRNGKAVDDGYRAVHLYYKLDNYHYQIEIQLWADCDYDFNNWMHTTTYKYATAEATRTLRSLYDQGIITTEQEFKRELQRYDRFKISTGTQEISR